MNIHFNKNLFIRLLKCVKHYRSYNVSGTSQNIEHNQNSDLNEMERHTYLYILRLVTNDGLLQHFQFAHRYSIMLQKRR